jgi:hydroxymethylbilane synthase
VTTGKTLIVGTRGSRLARAQADSVVALLRERCSERRFQVRVVSTTGDVRQQPLSEIAGEGVFTKELESALLSGEIDIAVHSLKDLPTELARGLTLAAVTHREDPSDALVSRDNTPLAKLWPGARVGTGSIRRAAQLRLIRPEVEPVPIRGNVDTRVRKAESGEGVDAVIVAAAALARLGWLDRAAEIISLEAMLPAPGQGALALETRHDDEETKRLAALADDRDSHLATAAERAFLRRLGGGCRIPVAALGVIENGQLRLTGLVVDPSGTRAFREEIEGNPEDAESVGEKLAADLLHQGADEILEELSP